MVDTFLPADDENPEHIRHALPVPSHGQSYDDSPGRWYRINVQFVPTLIALCDYYVHPDAHDGTEEERESAARSWLDLQIYLMMGALSEENPVNDTENPFCEEVAACLDSGNLDQSIQNVVNNITYGGDADTIKADAPPSKVELVYDCDPDTLYGAVEQMVDLFHTLITDFLQNAVAATNWATKTEYAVRSIPLIGSLPYDEMIGMIAILTQDMSQNYQASYNEGLRNDYICDLFCEALDGCHINLFGVSKYFGNRFWTEFTDVTWFDIVELILEGFVSGTEVVHAFHTVCAFSLAAGASFLGISGDLFTAMMKSFFNDPNPDWQDLCDACEVGCSVLLFFAESHFGFTIMPDKLGAWESGEGFVLEGGKECSNTGCGVRFNFPQAYNITKFTAKMEMRWGDESSVIRPYAITAYAGEESVTESATINGNSGVTYTREISVYPEYQTDAVEFWAKAGGKGDGARVRILSLQMWFGDECPDEWEEQVV